MHKYLFALVSIFLVSCSTQEEREQAFDQLAVAKQTFGSNIDFIALANYANQGKPSYVTKDNTGGNGIIDKQATLGRVLFYDKKLSINNSISCASCHKQSIAFGDTAVQSAGVSNGKTIRHSMRLINLRFANGTLGTFMLSDTAASARSWEQTSQENKAYTSYGDEDCYVISGTRGSLSVPTMRLKTYAHDEDRSWWKPFEVSSVTMVREDPLLRQIDHLCDVIQGRAAPLVTARDGLNNLRVTEAIARAADTGALVEISQT